MQIRMCWIMEIVLFEFVNGITQQSFSGMSVPPGWCLSKRQALDSRELCWPRGWAACDLVTHPELLNSPLRSVCENKASQQWGSNKSCAVTLSGMLMSLQVIGGQWAPHGPTPSPLAPCVSLSVHTHKETTLAQGHIFIVLPGKRTRSPLTDTFVLCNIVDVYNWHYSYGPYPGNSTSTHWQRLMNNEIGWISVST